MRILRRYILVLSELLRESRHIFPVHLENTGIAQPVGILPGYELRNKAGIEADKIPELRHVEVIFRSASALRIGAMEQSAPTLAVIFGLYDRATIRIIPHITLDDCSVD